MNINMQAAINVLSYGIVGTNITTELVKAGHSVSLFPITGRVNPDDIQNPVNRQYIKQALDMAELFDKNAPSIKLFHQFALAEQVGKPKIGWPIFELTEFNKVELNHLNSCDYLIVCSKWAKDIINEQVPNVRCEVVGLGIDPTIFFPCYNNSVEGSPTIFYFNGKYELRKGMFELNECFNLAFQPSDNVELWLSPHNYFLTETQVEEWVNLFKNSKLGDKIKIIPRLTNQADIAKIMNDCDCGISLSRAEGWNLGANEILACGKSLIITNYSAHTEFCNKQNSMLIDIDSHESAFDGIFFKTGIGSWAEIGERQIEQAVNYMREIHSKKQNGQLLVNEEGIKTAQEFTWANAAKKLVNVLENL